MGLGDELMARGDAWYLHQKHGARRVQILNAKGEQRVHPLWKYDDWIAKIGQRADVTLVHGGNCRPYIDYPNSTKRRWQWNLAYRARTAPPSPESGWTVPYLGSKGAVVLEPNIKHTAPPGKRWPMEQWQALVNANPDVEWVQPVYRQDAAVLKNVRHIRSLGHGHAIAMMAGARAAVLHEGFMHHVAAMLDVPAVVLFGAFIPPSVTGYNAHANLFVDDPEALGWRVPHPRLEEAWKEITPQKVMDALRPLL